MKGFLAAGIRSGCGKTSLCLGLLAACRARGLAVQPYKTGPDFIDPGLHRLAANRPSHNLDGWMCPPESVAGIFARNAQGADLAVAEGAMGLFDGFSGADESGSAAQAAKGLGLPVVLVADASSMARSAAALVKGYLDFDPGLAFAGVVFNNVTSPSHETLLRQAVEAYLDAPLLGCLARDESIATPSRHLGLVTAEDLDQTGDRMRKLAAWVDQGIDLDRLLAACPDLSPALPDDPTPPEPRVRIGLARDRAFCFYYEENLRLLRMAGAELVEFSPIADKRLPEDLDGLYLGGGYPELAALELSNNASMRKDIRRFSESGRPVYAECGGFIYLLAGLEDVHGRTFPMAGVFPFSARMQPRRAALGYRKATLSRDCILGPAGTELRGHEFHYSSLADPPDPEGDAFAFTLADRTGRDRPPEGHLMRNTLGTYVHMHFGSNPRALEHFVGMCAGGG